MLIRSLAILAAGALALPAAAAADPWASFFFSPQAPRAGDTVRFQSTSCDPEGGEFTQAWDLDGDGAFDDATGRSATRTYTKQGVLSVGLQVTGAAGEVSTRRASLTVDSIYALPVPDVMRLMSPFPFVRLRGEVFRRRTRIDLLAISEAPSCARVVVTCTGRGCRRKRVVRFKAPRQRLRIRAWDRRRLAPRAVLGIRVSKGNLIGRVVRFRMRRGLPPKRVNRCLLPGATTPSRCPQD